MLGITVMMLVFVTILGCPIQDSQVNDNYFFKGTVSQDWRELLMVERDKAHFFNVFTIFHFVLLK